MNLNTRISEIMERDLITVDISDSLKEVMAIFNEIKIRHIPVLTGSSLIGMISHTDVLKVDEVNKIIINKVSVANRNIPEIELRKVMAQNPVTIEQDKTILDAAEVFAKNQFHALPVTSEGDLVGIITTTDIMKFIIGQTLI
ncbi:MAG: CBS domain-containing protein [Reichenbachiella sp.]|uniref:CBS domain-containing protein n=1 Tax=Reichenbachiella sp. TaxID=2184521 RepID=UPI0032974D30